MAAIKKTLTKYTGEIVTETELFLSTAGGIISVIMEVSIGVP